MLDMAGACALFLAVFSFSGQLPYNFQKASILTYVIYLIARPVTQLYSCLLYTSDAADEL